MSTASADVAEPQVHNNDNLGKQAPLTPGFSTSIMPLFPIMRQEVCLTFQTKRALPLSAVQEVMVVLQEFTILTWHVDCR